jgi:hypothetical protein
MCSMYGDEEVQSWDIQKKTRGWIDCERMEARPRVGVRQQKWGEWGE